MSLVSELTATKSWADVPLDPSLLALRPDETAFFKAQTGIEDEEVLRQHIIKNQEEAYQVAPYPCIRRFGFTRHASLKISRHPSYDEVMDMGRNNPTALLLDLACCVGNDARKAAADGWPAERIVASDLHPEFWDVGHRLFRSTPQSCPIQFIPGDLFSDAFLSSSAPPSPPPEGRLVNPKSLHGAFSAIHVAAFFHLFPLDKQREAASRIITLLAREPGSIIFGSNIGSDIAGQRLGQLPHLHNEQSWREMWASCGESDLEVSAELKSIDGYLGEGVRRRGTASDVGENAVVSMKWLVWSVRRHGG
ncbi:hypothetical protein EXIGLDRAFT_603603 [Exidia glandulosa HHB12029]|uniref:Methyltransferase domain-containing protein n=1 Tax=Exidia glandulosa HHB12029 TaxID=1314781 RepID=A0A165NM53_EXIGL|nr:hypothetical protein EXIGLDRAFT_603603 [Exidia glandulosa HHB12029]